MFEDVRMDHFDTFRRFPGELGELGCHEAWDLDASQRKRLPRGGRHGRRVAWQRGGIRVDQRRAGSRSRTLRTLRTSHTSCTSVLGDFNHRENQYTWDHLSLSIDLRDSYIDWYQAIDQFAVIFLSFLNYLFWEQLSCQKGSADKTDRQKPCECHTDAVRMPHYWNSRSKKSQIALTVSEQTWDAHGQSIQRDCLKRLLTGAGQDGVSMQGMQGCFTLTQGARSWQTARQNVGVWGINLDSEHPHRNPHISFSFAKIASIMPLRTRQTCPDIKHSDAFRTSGREKWCSTFRTGF